MANILTCILEARSCPWGCTPEHLCEVASEQRLKQKKREKARVRSHKCQLRVYTSSPGGAIDVTGNARQRFLECSIILSVIKEHGIRFFGVKASRNDFELWILIHEYNLKRQEERREISFIYKVYMKKNRRLFIFDYWIFLLYIIYLFNFGDININPYQIETFIYRNWDNIIIYFLAKFTINYDNILHISFFSFFLW